MEKFEPLEEIFIWGVSEDTVVPRGLTISSINGDGSGYNFFFERSLRCRIVGESAYWRIKQNDVYEFVENRAGGMIFKRVNE